VNQVTTTAITYSGNRGGGTVRTTVTGTGTTASTVTTTNCIGAGCTGVVSQVSTAALPATASSFTVSKMIDGAIFKGGVQFKF
jgi:hypothetical protein